MLIIKCELKNFSKICDITLFTYFLGVLFPVKSILLKKFWLFNILLLCFIPVSRIPFICGYIEKLLLPLLLVISYLEFEF